MSVVEVDKTWRENTQEYNEGQDNEERYDDALL
jgi:hypothetical protein